MVRTSQDDAQLAEHVKRQNRTSGTPTRSPLHPGRTKVKATGRGDDMVSFYILLLVSHSFSSVLPLFSKFNIVMTLI
jgi:hypothetical protein